jgi:hypothetical protein
MLINHVSYEMAIVGAETPIIYIYMGRVKQLNGLIYIGSLPQEGIKVNQEKTEICRESLQFFSPKQMLGSGDHLKESQWCLKGTSSNE